MNSNIPYQDFGGDGPLLHLAHANGFSAEMYRSLAYELIPNYHVIGMNARPLWAGSNPDSFATWHTAAEDLIRFLDEQKWKNIIGVGHSFGAIITVFAAIKRPDLFSKLVLIEPVILPKWVYWMAALMPIPLLKKWNPVAKQALTRSDKWPDRKVVFKHFRRKKVFARMSDEALWAYVNSGTTEHANGVILKYPKEWEAQIFVTISDPWKALRKLDKPCLIIRGENSDTITPKVWSSAKNTFPSAEFLEIQQAGHLVPFEATSFLAEKIKTFLASEPNDL